MTPFRPSEGLKKKIQEHNSFSSSLVFREGFLKSVFAAPIKIIFYKRLLWAALSGVGQVNADVGMGENKGSRGLS